MCGYFCIRFIDSMLKGKSLLVYTNLFSPKESSNNTKIFSVTKRMKKLYCIIGGKFKKFEEPKISYFSGRTLVLSIICRKCRNKDEKLFKEEYSTEILKILALIENI